MTDLSSVPTDDLVAELSRREEITADHEVRIEEGKYGLKHPWRCRADLIACELNQHLMNWPDDLPKLSPGRYIAVKVFDHWEFTPQVANEEDE